FHPCVLSSFFYRFRSSCLKRDLKSHFIIRPRQIYIESVISSCCFVVPPHFFHAVGNGGHISFVRFADSLSLLNYDILLFPINSDLTLYGRGLHWFLAVAELKSKTVTIMDSLNNEYNKYCAVLQKMLYVIHSLCSSVEFLETDWTWIVSADCPKQSNSYDCGVHVILNSYIICNGLNYVKSFDSNRVRQWIQTKILEVDYSYLTTKQTTKHTFVAGKINKYNSFYFCSCFVAIKNNK
uniref:Ubiquitin-like protease family profile domain-containing protein n=1 Tax=Leptobrachium leishanense TaxID=445787 RepID=A0A8C5MCB0_9ANUR